MYSGAEEEHHRGVGLILKREVRRTLLKWNPVNERIMSACLNSHFAKLTIIQVYAETAARNNCSSDLYQLTRKIAGQRRNMTTIKDRQGK